MLLQNTMVRHLTLLVAVLECVAPIRATTLERLSLDDMIEASTAIVRGHVDASYTAYRGNMIYTHFPVEVTETLKGTSAAAKDVMVPGGTVGGIHQAYSGVPQLVEGKEYVLFLWTSPSGVTQIIGFTQGVFTLSKSTSGQSVAVQAPTTATLIDPSSGQVVRNNQGISLRLNDLRARVAAVTTGAKR